MKSHGTSKRSTQLKIARGEDDLLTDQSRKRCKEQVGRRHHRTEATVPLHFRAVPSCWMIFPLEPPFTWGFPSQPCYVTLQGTSRHPVRRLFDCGGLGFQSIRKIMLIQSSISWESQIPIDHLPRQVYRYTVLSSKY